MKITESSQLANSFNVGDILWGCAYAYNQCADSAADLIQTPIKGILSPCRHEKDHADAMANQTKFINYFIPMKKDGKTPSWQKAMKVYTLNYASTEVECCEMYNETIDANIKWHKSEISKLAKSRIKIPVAQGTLIANGNV